MPCTGFPCSHISRNAGCRGSSTGPRSPCTGPSIDMAYQPYVPLNRRPITVMRSLRLLPLPPWPIKTRGTMPRVESGRHKTPGIADPARSTVNARSMEPPTLASLSVHCIIVGLPFLRRSKFNLAVTGISFVSDDRSRASEVPSQQIRTDYPRCTESREFILSAHVGAPCFLYP